MTELQDASRALADAVRAAHLAGMPLRIHGGNSKRWYGNSVATATSVPRITTLDVRAHRGIVHYEPAELIITARAGTLITNIESALDEQNQMLAFEPPYFGNHATLGGTIACGFSGPRRPYAGAARDFVLGVRIINGRGELLRFGGEVMKNVAGYDIARLMAGSLGSLGVLMEVSLKVLPKPRAELTVARESSAADAIRLACEWAGKPLPLSAIAHDGARMFVRLSGAERAIAAARATIGGEPVENGTAFWHSMREQTHPFFDGTLPLWRLSVPPASAPIALPGTWFIDWGGAQRWLRSDAPAADIRAAAEQAGGHATGFRYCAREDVFHPLSPASLALHKRIKTAFDPERILNPGVLYPDL
jgi:glycolate oxidase FAD binding subunit